MINKPFFQFFLTSRKLVSKRMHMWFFFLIVWNQLWKKKYPMWPPNRSNFQSRILNDFFLSLKDKKLKRCPSCNVLPFSLDRLGQDFSCRLRTHCGCFCASWVSLLFCFFLPHIAKLSGNISFKLDFCNCTYLQSKKGSFSQKSMYVLSWTFSNNFLS